MKTASIPATVELKSGTYTGKFTKRAGSRNDPNLYCWFSEESDDHYPHASIDLSGLHANWRYFHISYPVMKKKGWSDELERRSQEMADGTVQSTDWTTARTEILAELEQRRARRATS